MLNPIPVDPAGREAQPAADPVPVAGDEAVGRLDQSPDPGQAGHQGEGAKQGQRAPDPDQCRAPDRPPTRRVTDVEGLAEHGGRRRIGQPGGNLERREVEPVPTVQPAQESRAVRADAAVGVVKDEQRTAHGVTPGPSGGLGS